ncbi:MOSC domain-containing protein [Glycomyces paridis]|uniref:MOSC domain-containing protein n=1 Tax=Glycomyces paridis TaxID=2126555 RepID=A0A4S8PL12_9ACTN|nr:MOSC domain-containing protein [Glycomyces paridis]THV31448.1 MOSC domain-containing protein [Glycomyces paridis]
MKILSVNVGRPRDNPWKKDPDATYIDKRPVDGPVAVTAPGPKGDGSVGLAGDRVGDVAHHGGTDQAVYAYSTEDYAHFAALTGREFGPGAFGENLTTAGHDLSAALIGERWAGPGGLVLEVTSARIPCGTFRGWIAERGWLKTFTREARPGPYLRVVEPGEVEAGTEFAVVHRPDHGATVSLLFRASMGERELIPALLEVPDLSEGEKAYLRARYEQG